MPWIFGMLQWAFAVTLALAKFHKLHYIKNCCPNSTGEDALSNHILFGLGFDYGSHLPMMVMAWHNGTWEVSH